jgi:hypothetical protein
MAGIPSGCGQGLGSWPVGNSGECCTRTGGRWGRNRPGEGLQPALAGHCLLTLRKVWGIINAAVVLFTRPGFLVTPACQCLSFVFLWQPPLFKRCCFRLRTTHYCYCHCLPGGSFGHWCEGLGSDAGMKNVRHTDVKSDTCTQHGMTAENKQGTLRVCCASKLICRTCVSQLHRGLQI